MCPNWAGQVKLVILEIDFIVCLYLILQAWSISKFCQDRMVVHNIDWPLAVLAFGLDLGPAVSQCHDPVENMLAGARVRIKTEIA